MNILNANIISYRRGGPREVAYQTARELIKRGHKVYSYSALPPRRPSTEYTDLKELTGRFHGPVREPMYPLSDAGYRVLSSAVKFARFSLSSILVLRRLYDEYKIDIVRIDAPIDGFYVIPSARLSNVKTVAVAHGLFSLYRKNTGFWRFIDKQVYNRVDKIIAVSQPIREKILDLGIPEDRVCVVPNGVALAEFDHDFDIDSFKNQYDLKDKKIVLNVGRLGGEKALENLFDAVKIISKTRATRLVLAGDGPLKEELMALAKSLKLDVFFAGFLSKEELLKFYRIADVFVSSASYEPAALVLFEAMASSLPIVATNVWGNAQYIKHNENGQLVEVGNTEDMANAVLEVLDNPQLANKLGANGRKLVEKKYNWEAISKQVEDVYLDVLES